MGTKIKSLKNKPTFKRICMICGKGREMEKFQRFCSPICRQRATDLDKFSNEHNLIIKK